MASQSQAIQNLSPETKSQAVDAARPAAQLMERATAHRSENHSTAHDSSSDRGGKEALMHHKAQTHSQQRSRGMER
jgi:hypothetical protein